MPTPTPTDSIFDILPTWLSPLYEHEINSEGTTENAGLCDTNKIAGVENATVSPLDS